MVSAEGLKLGQIAVQLGYVTEEQLSECLALQKKMQEIGVKEPLGHIFMKKNIVSKDQLQQILRTAGIYKEIVPGYEIISKLGVGGMGIVYKAKHITTERLIALKLLSPTLAKDQNYVKRFIREAKLAARVNHPNIVITHDVGEHEGRFFIAMEFVDGTTVKKLAKERGGLAEQEATQVVRDVASALEEIARHGMIHRDIKPENIMLTREGTVKLCDFGLAKVSEEVEKSLTVTQEGYAVGTPYYMSPEQIKEERNLDIRSDIYSLGVTYYYLLTGKVPFDAESPNAVLAKHLTDPATPPNRIKEGISNGASNVCLKMMEKDPSRRYQTPEELKRDLDRVLSGENASISQTFINVSRVGIDNAKSVFSRVPKKLKMASGVLTALILVAILLLPSSKKEEPENSGADNTMAVDGVGSNDAEEENKEQRINQERQERELEARSIHTKIKLLQRTGKPSEAMGEIEKLRSNYGSTQYYMENKEEIEALEKDIVLKTKEAKQALKNLNKSFIDGQINTFEKRYEAAMDKRQYLTDEELKELRQLKRRYDDFKKYKMMIAQLASDYEKGLFTNHLRERIKEAIDSDLFVYLSQKEQGKMYMGLNNLDHELEAASLLSSAEDAFIVKDYKALSSIVKELNQYEHTRTFESNREQASRYKMYLATMKKNIMEEEAISLLSRAEEAERSGEDKVAILLYGEFLERYRETEVFKKRGDQVADTKARLIEQREEKAKGVFERLSTLYSNEEFDEAREELLSLEGYSDTVFYKEHEKEIMRMTGAKNVESDVVGDRKANIITGYQTAGDWVFGTIAKGSEMLKFVLQPPKFVGDRREGTVRIILKRRKDDLKPDNMPGRFKEKLMNQYLFLSVQLDILKKNQPEGISLTWKGIDFDAVRVGALCEEKNRDYIYQNSSRGHTSRMRSDGQESFFVTSYSELEMVPVDFLRNRDLLPEGLEPGSFFIRIPLWLVVKAGVIEIELKRIVITTK